VLAEQAENNWLLAKAEAEWLEATEALERAQHQSQEKDKVRKISI
jgi:hypothetical protein